MREAENKSNIVGLDSGALNYLWEVNSWNEWVKLVVMPAKALSD